MVELSGIKDEKPKEECGVFALYLHPSLANPNIIETALSSAIHNQHRGEESSGFCVADGSSLWPPTKKMGQIRDLYSDYVSEKRKHGGLFGHIAIVHNRYSTTGSSTIENAAPYRFETNLGVMSIIHNGNITNAVALKSELLKNAVSFQSTTDSEVIGALIKESPGLSWEEKICSALQKLEGSFSVIISTVDTIYAARDKFGIRPLSIGEFTRDGKKCFAVSSETGCLDDLKALKIWEIPPGKVIKIKDGDSEIFEFAQSPKEALCGLEIAYLLRADSRIKEAQVNAIRRYLGRKLARLYPPPGNIDFVTYIPESSRQAAEGYSEELSLRMLTSMQKGRYGTLNGSVRGFINPDTKTREKIARHYFVYDVVKDKEIVLIDDSIIRGTTTSGVITALRERGVKKIHLRIVFPPVISYCPLGTDINERDFLVAKNFGKDIDKIASFIGVDTLSYLSPYEFANGINDFVGKNVGLCLGCATRNYPVENFEANKLIFENEIK